MPSHFNYRANNKRLENSMVQLHAEIVYAQGPEYLNFIKMQNV